MPLMSSGPPPLTTDPPVTSGLEAQIVDPGSFSHSAGPSSELQDFSGLAPSAACAPPVLAAMEASSMGDIQDQGDPQNQQSSKYDLLASLPCEYEL